MVVAATIGRRVTVTTFYLLLFLLILNTLPTISLPSSQEQEEGIDYYDEENTISTTAATTATTSSVGNKNKNDNVNTTTTKDPLLFANFNSLYKERQGFFLVEGNGLFESSPDSKLSPFKVLSWWCDLEFLKLSSSSEEEKIDNNYYYNGGYTGRTINFFLDPGVTTSDGSNKYIGSVSAMFIPSLNTFEGQIHSTGENWVDRFWDDGILSAPIRYISWDTMSFSGFGTYTKIKLEQAADYFSNNSINVNKNINININAELTPETCSGIYKEVWESNTKNKQQLQEQNQQQKQPDHKINTSKTTKIISPKEEVEAEEISQLKAINSDLLSRLEVIENILAYYYGDNGQSADDVIPSCRNSKNGIKNGINIVGNVKKHCIAFLSATASLIDKASLTCSLHV